MKTLFVAYCLLSLPLLFVQPQPEKPQFKKVAGPKRPEQDKLEGKAPPALQVFDWTNSGGKEVVLADLKGKVVLLHFWGVWSPECKTATPELKKLHQKYTQAGLVLVGIHTTRQGGKMADYLKAEAISWPVAIDKFGGTVQAFVVDDFPAYYLLDRQGVLRVADLGATDLERALGILLKE